MSILSIVILAIFIEAVWESLKMIWVDGAFNVNRLGTLIIGVALCILAKADLPGAVGIDLGSAWVSYLVTGIITGRGSNYVHDLLTAVKGLSSGTGSIDPPDEES